MTVVFHVIIPVIIGIAISSFILYQVVLAAVSKALMLNRYDGFILCPNCQCQVIEGKECPRCGKRYSRYVEMPPRNSAETHE
jgi:predicted amidophosphoribosyltransferase